MGSTRPRDGDHEDEESSFITSHKSHFFKIILDEAIREGKLGIPRKFVRKYSNSLPNSVLLSVPSGAEWHVELSKHGDNVWFENGWREFVDHYSLDFGHLLVFEYQENGKFNVLIFDKSATEIYYCEEPKHDGDLPKEPEIERNEDDVSVEISDDFTINRRARARSPLSCPLSRKRTTRQQFGLYGGETSTGLKSKEAGADERTWLPKSKKNNKAVERANGFKSENPYFMVFMERSYVLQGCGLTVPTMFVSKYMMKQQSLDTMLTVEDKSWPVRLAIYKSNAGKIGRGSAVFVKENAIQVGDVCVFELINTDVSALKVTIFRHAG